MATRRFRSRRDLRKEVEGHIGQLSDEDWSRVEPAHEPDYGPEDLQEVIEALVPYTSSPDRFPGLEEVLQGEPFAVLVARVQVSLLMAERSSLDLERLGRLLLALALVQNQATVARQPVEAVLARLLGATSDPVVDWTMHARKNAVGAIAAAIQPRKRGTDWILYFRDREITKDLMAETLAGWNRESSARSLAAWKLNRHIGPTAEQRWLVYEARYGELDGRSFKSVAGYKKAVNRARKDALSFLARNRLSTRAGTKNNPK